MQDSDEVLERKARLGKIIDQGSKVEQLYLQEEFQFFLGWVDSVREILKNDILKGTQPNKLGYIDEKTEWHKKGGYSYLTQVIDGAELFANKAKKARNQLKKLEEDIEANE